MNENHLWIQLLCLLEYTTTVVTLSIDLCWSRKPSQVTAIIQGGRFFTRISYRRRRGFVVWYAFCVQTVQREKIIERIRKAHKKYNKLITYYNYNNNNKITLEAIFFINILVYLLFCFGEVFFLSPFDTL